MNIGQLLRSVIGEFQAAEGKMLELKAGQIVRGVVLQMLAEQDALMSINGVHVRAALETPLPVGQAALFQVQPKSDDGRIVLKSLASSDAQIAEQTQTEVLRSIGLKDTEGNRQAVQELTNGRLPVNKDNVVNLAESISNKPEQVQEGQWKEAALLAVRRGLPPTAETVGALHRTLFGKPLNETLDGLAKQLAGLLEQVSTDQPMSPPVRELAVRVKQALEAIPLSPVAGTEEAESGNQAGTAERNSMKQELPPSTGGKPAASESGGEAPLGERSVMRSPPVQMQSAKAELTPAGENPAEGLTQPEGEMPLTEGPVRETAARDRIPLGPTSDAKFSPASNDERSPSGDAKLSAAVVKEAEPPAKTGGTSDAASASASKPTPREASPQQEGGNWIPRLLKALGVEHEHQFMRLAAKTDALEPSAEFRHADAETGKAAADTLKGLLLQLSAQEDVPQSVRDTAREAVQQITGQQLLLTPDRGSAFSHVTLMLPLLQEGGRQTAAIHIQSRKGSRGELDAENCRLLFDLDMKTLGSTLVDVQVTDKIVGLRVHNDQPIMAELLEANREEIAAGLGGIGYQFLSLKCLPYPEKLSDGADMAGKAGTAGPGPSAALAGKYHANDYKGMDIRV